MKVKVKKLNPDAVVPKYGTNFAAGADLTATSMKVTDRYISYGVGLAFELPPGHCAFLFQRSSVSNMDLTLANAVGLLDEDFRGEVSFRFRTTNNSLGAKYYQIGDRIGQIVVVPYSQLTFEVVEELSESIRNDGGYGSTGQ